MGRRTTKNNELGRWFLEPLNRDALKSRARGFRRYGLDPMVPAELRVQAMEISDLYQTLAETVEAGLEDLKTANSALWDTYRIIYEGGGTLKDVAAQTGIKAASASANNILLMKTVLRYLEGAGFEAVEGKLYRDGEPLKAEHVNEFLNEYNAWKDGANMRETEGSDKG